MNQNSDHMATLGDPLLTLREACIYTGCSDSYLRDCINRADEHPLHLAAIRHAGKIKIRHSALEDWITRTSEPA
jgi:hypothetical protein